MKDYTNGEYCCGCYNLQLDECNCSSSSRFGSPRTRPTKDGQKWLKQCVFFINHENARLNRNRFYSLRIAVSRSFEEYGR